MGLSVMEDVPGADQQLRFANVAGHSAYIPPNAWVGEQGLLGLGFDGDDAATSGKFQQNVSAVTQGIASIAQSLGPLFGKKSKRGSQPQRQPVQDQSMIQAQPTSTGIPSWLIYGGVAILGIGIIYMVIKKKNTDKKGD